MATTTDLEKLVINYLTQDQYDDAREAGTLNANELYLTPNTGSTNGTVTSVATGGGLTGGPITTSGTISHADTSSQSSVSNSGRTYIQSITLDTYGHVTGLTSATESVTDTDTKVTQAYSTTNSSYPVLFSATSDITSTSSRGATTAILNNAIYVNPSTGNLQVTKLNSYTPAAAMAKAVDTSISAASTSANLPTSAAVAAFVEGKGYITTDSDEKLKTVALTSGTTYYPILANGANAAATRQVDSTLAGLKYVSSAGSTSTVGTATLYLGNSTASGSNNNEQGVLRMYATNTRYVDIKTESTYAPTGARNRYLPSYDADMYLVGTNTTNAVGGATTAPVYVDNTGCIQVVTSIPYSLLTGTPTIPTDTNTTYTLTNALSSHKFTWTFTAGGSGSGSTTTTAELVQGNNITLTDDTTNKKITIAATDTTYGIATNTTVGLVKPWYYWQQSSTGPIAGTVNSSATVNARSATAGRYYPIEMDKDGRMFVNVPWSAGGDVPSTTGSSITGITISNHSTGTVRGVKTGTNSTTTASKASGGNGSAPSLTVTSTTVANSITGAIDSSDSTMLVISLGTTSVGSASGWSAGSAATWSFTDVTVPIRADSDSTFVTSTTHTVTDPGHTHSI